jgi:putative photosynthetic complex assembly protein 2
MLATLAPLAFTLFVWWFATGVILYLDGLPRRTFKFTMAGATALAGLGFVGLAVSSRSTTPAAAYCAFTCALLVWAWQEVAFLLGIVTGPRRVPCPSDARGWRRAALAFATVVHHELGLVVLGAGVIAVSWGQPNRTGLWTFVILWVMRQSAKLNVFLGVRNLSEEFLPPHLKYLQTYFTRKAMNVLWPVSVIAATCAVVPLWMQANAAGTDSFAFASSALLATLLSLAILEHLFLVLPIPFAALWKWGMRSHARAPGIVEALATSPER